ncbi:FAAR175Cp [Eremothecium gossypii FDAG1]|nr:FAAR175Cp [Eremothecium gossypii FDAG1]
MSTSGSRDSASTRESARETRAGPQALPLGSVVSLSSMRSASPTHAPWVAKPTTSVDLTNHFMEVAARGGEEERSLASPGEEMQYELAHSMKAAPALPRELPSPFRAAGGRGALPQEKQFFVLTAAGKPIYSMHGPEELVMGLMGIAHTLLNYFELDGPRERLRTITTYDAHGVLQRFAFLRKKHVVLLAMTTRNEAEAELQQQLDLLYSYLVSSLSLRQMSRLFERANFDLRSFLTESDFHNLDQLCRAMCDGTHLGWTLGALECITLKHSVRQRINSIMLRATRGLAVGTLLYGMIVAPDHRLVSVLRPKGHTLHTTDLQLLFSMVENQLQLLHSSQEVWVPLCFPKFNGNGFLYCYIKFLPTDTESASNETTLEGNMHIKPTLILISPQKSSFYDLHTCASEILDNLAVAGIMPHITAPSRFTINDIPAPLVHHFIYKSKKYVQYVMPETSSTTDWSTLMKYYSHLRSNALDSHGNPLSENVVAFARWCASSGQVQVEYCDSSEELQVEDQPSSIFSESFVEESLNMTGLSWITPSFELYLLCNNGEIPKAVVMKSARNVVGWCSRNGHKLFVSEGAVF